MLIPKGSKIVRLNQDGTPVNPNYEKDKDFMHPSSVYMKEIKEHLLGLQNLIDELDMHLEGTDIT